MAGMTNDDANRTQEKNWNILKELLSKSKLLAKLLSERLTISPTATERASKRKRGAQASFADSDSDNKKQPVLLTGGTMRPYQLEGFVWLNTLFKNGLNGILGDEMGLGKTIQVIALLAHLIDMDVPGPYLVCAPLSTLKNWKDEFQRFTPKLPVMLYHGDIAERTVMRTQFNKQLEFADGRFCLPIIITSYEIVMKDEPFFKHYKWVYIIIDEGHRIKNFRCKLFSCLTSLMSSNRLLLTGTPLQNNLAELWALLHFLMPDLFTELKAFNSWFDVSSLNDEGIDERIVKQEQEKHILATFHEIVSPFMLRRLKSDVALFIPPKQEFIIKAPLMQRQEELYKAILNKTISTSCLQDYKESRNTGTMYTESEETRPKRLCTLKHNGMITKSVLQKYSNTTVASMAKKEENDPFHEVNLKTGNNLMALRKACNHPYQIEYPLDAQTNEYQIDENIINCSGKMIVLDILLHLLKEKGHKVLIFSQMTSMLDIIQDFCYFRGYKYCRLDGKIKLNERHEQIESFNKDLDCFVFLISTRAGGLGINLVAADTVIIYDSDWNPQCDLQAMARCHRIGQTKPVVILRLVTENSIDESMVKRAAAKRKLEKLFISKELFKTGSRENHSLDPQLLLDLLTSCDHAGVIFSQNDKLLMTEELGKLLDRHFDDKNSDSDSVPVAVENSQRITVVERD